MADVKKTIKQKVFDTIFEALEGMKLEVKFSIDYPQQAEHGDYATNVALIVSRALKKGAPEVAYEIVANMKIDKNIFEEVEVSSKGFINFFLRKDYVFEQLSAISKATFGQSLIGEKVKINLEFISANPTGPLHLGHARGAFYGDALSNILKMAGYVVTREYYINDAKESNQIRELGRTVLGLGQSYAGPYLDEKINDFKKKGFSFTGVSEAEAGRLIAQAIQEDNKAFIEDKLNIVFNKWFSEERLYEEGLTDSMFNALQKRGLIYQNEGALWLKSTEFGDVRDRVLVRSEEKGSAATYYYSDTAYFLDKCERGFSVLAYVLGADHHDDVMFLNVLPKLFNKDIEVKTVLTQLVSFKKDNLAVRLSKRKGQVINLDWLLEEVGVDAVRFFYLMKSISTHMEFDVDLAKSKNLDNPVFYVQYTHARLASILRKAKEGNLLPDFKNTQFLGAEEEFELMKNLLRFPELVEETAINWQVHSMPHYVLHLAVLINSFYEKIRIIEPKNPELTLVRLGLISAAKNVMSKALGIMGVSAPLKM